MKRALFIRLPLSLLLLAWGSLPLDAEDALRILPAGQRPDDSRLREPRTLHDYFPMRPVNSAVEWESRGETIRRRIALAAGLWPEPTKTPLEAVVRDRREMDGYSVEKVYFQSVPGHFVTGSLYRPTTPPGEKGYPGVLCPHGHWAQGRFYDRPEAQRGPEIARGGERFVDGARSPLQARCVQLARMGCVVFHYDMLGYADSIQFEEHRRGPREHLQGLELGKWGFVSAAADARLQTNFGLQTWNSVRALDFLTGLEDIDQDRLLVTGASGGATQTMILAAIDDRIDAAFPAVMVSTAMQGGCTCENAHYLRIDQGNIDIAAAVAPRPQEITAADDWTIELKEKGAPALYALYETLGAKGRFEAHYDIHFKHNFNHVSRTHLYDFVNRHFRLGQKSPVLESDFEFLDREALTVWGGDHPAPEGDQAGEAHEKALCRWLAEDAAKQVVTLLRPEDGEALERSREILGGAYELIVRRGVPAADEVAFGLEGKEERAGYLEMTGLIGNDTHGEELPAAFLHPSAWNGKVVVWVDDAGKRGLFDGPGAPREAVARLVDEGYAVVGVDLFQQGEFLNPGEEARNAQVQYPGDASKPGAAWRKSSVYFYGYNDSIFVRRVHDLLTTVSFVRNHESWDVKEVSLIGEGAAGALVAATRAMAGAAVDRAFVDDAGFRFAGLDDRFDPHFLPGAVKYGDLAGQLLLSAPHPLWLSTSDPALGADLAKVYELAGASEAFHLATDEEPAETQFLEVLLGGE